MLPQLLKMIMPKKAVAEKVKSSVAPSPTTSPLSTSLPKAVPKLSKKQKKDLAAAETRKRQFKNEEAAISQAADTAKTMETLVAMMNGTTVKTTGFQGLGGGDDKKAKIKQEAFMKSISGSLDNISKNTEKIATDVDKNNDKNQTAGFGEKEESGGGFISGAIAGISKTVKSEAGPGLMALLMPIIGGLISFYRNMKKKGGGSFFKGLWITIDKYVQTKFGGWDKFIWESLKGIGNVALWIADVALGALYGDQWEEAQIFWTSNWDFFKNWWETTATAISNWWNYVNEVGFGTYIAEKLFQAVTAGHRFVGELAFKLVDPIMEKAFGKDWLVVKEMAVEWWGKEVAPVGGIFPYLKLKINEWWIDLIDLLPFDYLNFSVFGTDINLGDMLKSLYLGGNTVSVAKDNLKISRAEAIAAAEERKAIEEKYINAQKANQTRNIKRKAAINNEVVAQFNSLDKTGSRDGGITPVSTAPVAAVGTGPTSYGGYSGSNFQPFMQVITSPYGKTRAISGGQKHGGVDFRAAMNTSITSPVNGTVEGFQNTPNTRGGRVLVIRDDNGKRVMFMHLNSTNVKKGDVVKIGQTIAKSGNSGKGTSGKPYVPHIHFAVKEEKKTIDPLRYIASLSSAKPGADGTDGIEANSSGGTQVANNTINVSAAPQKSNTNGNDGVGAYNAHTKAINNQAIEINKLKARSATSSLMQAESNIQV